MTKHVISRLGLSRRRGSRAGKHKHCDRGRSSQRASPTERKSMTSSVGFPSSSATGRRATWSRVSSTRDAATPVYNDRQDRSALQQPQRRTTRAVQRAFGRREISCGPAMENRHETQPRRPGRDVARRRVEPAADRVRSTRLQVRILCLYLSNLYFLIV